MADSLEEAERLCAEAREAASAAQRAEVEAARALADAKLAHGRAWCAEEEAKREALWWRVRAKQDVGEAWPVPGLVDTLQWWGVRGDLVQMRRGADVADSLAYYGPPAWFAAAPNQVRHYYRGDGGMSACGDRFGRHNAGASMGKCAKCEKKLAKEGQ